jgi:hypothetical protein
MERLRTALAAALVLLFSPVVFGADVTGELVDLSCYKKDDVKNRGPAHQECATICAKKGMTVALVTEAGEVYLVGGQLAKNNNERLIKHMSHTVSLQGSLGVDNGTKTILASAMKMISK